MRMLLSFVLLLIIAGANAYFARQRGRDPVGWFLIGLLLGVIGLIILFIMPKHKKKQNELETDEDRILLGLGDGEENYANKDWYYLTEEHSQRGPMSFESLRKAWEEDKIRASTHVWCDGMERWEKISDIPLLMDAVAPSEIVK